MAKPATGVTTKPGVSQSENIDGENDEDVASQDAGDFLCDDVSSLASSGRGRYSDSPSSPEPREYITIPEAPTPMPVHEEAFNPAPVDVDFEWQAMSPAGKSKKNRVRKGLN